MYVSSTYGLTKRSGNLFKKVLQEERIENPAKVLHIGGQFHFRLYYAEAYRDEELSI